MKATTNQQKSHFSTILFKINNSKEKRARSMNVVLHLFLLILK